MQKHTLSETEISELRYEKFHYPHPIVQKRMFAVDLHEKGYSQEKIAEILDVCRQTISGYLKLYEEGGIARLKELGYVREKGEMQCQKASIESLFRANPPTSVAQAGEMIKQNTGIERKPTQVKRFMKRLGMKFIKTGQIPAKADVEKQADFMENKLEPLIERAKSEQIELLFLDAAHFILQPFLSCVWCFVRCFVLGSAGRNRINVLGAVNALTQKLSVFTNTDYISADTIVRFLHQIKSEYSKYARPIYIVLDNARYQHCKYVMETAEELKIHLVFLPPYSPNLNLIERLWKFVKKNVLYGKHFETPKKFHSTILDFLNQIQNNLHQNELKKLLSLRFQTFKDVKLLAA